jgi:uncharacterized protein DUF5818
MMKGSISLATLALAAVALAPLALAQSAQNQARPKALAGTELVAWSQDQKAEPMPSTQTTPPPAQKPEQQAPSTPASAQQPAPAQQDDAHKTPAAQAFTGTVMKSGDTYVLKTADNMTYQLDDQTRAKDFEGKQVQVTGSLDSSNNTIKVQDIKQAS